MNISSKSIPNNYLASTLNKKEFRAINGINNTKSSVMKFFFFSI